MALISYTSKEVDQMARLMRAEAIGEGELGMLMVGNVIVNRAIADCLTFKNTMTIESVIFQSPGGFAGVNSNLFYSSATTTEKELALRNLNGETYYPATHALWFYAPKANTACTSTWWDQPLAGRYKNHCFYEPKKGICKEIH